LDHLRFPYRSVPFTSGTRPVGLDESSIVAYNKITLPGTIRLSWPSSSCALRLFPKDSMRYSISALASSNYLTFGSTIHTPKTKSSPRHTLQKANPRRSCDGLMRGTIMNHASLFHPVLCVCPLIYIYIYIYIHSNSSFRLFRPSRSARVSHKIEKANWFGLDEEVRFQNAIF
jgi:hypothetical protein